MRAELFDRLRIGKQPDDVIFIPLTTGMLKVFGQRFLRTITVAVSDLDRMGAVQTQSMEQYPAGGYWFFSSWGTSDPDGPMPPRCPG